MTKTELQIALDYKCEQAQKMRDARRAEFQALLRKATSDVRIELESSLARRVKI